MEVPAPDAPREADAPVDRAPKDRKEKDRDKESKKDKKKRKKDKKDEYRRIDGWERYKALVDTLKESHDLVDLADHKARFALIIMGAQNAAILIVATRADIFSMVPDWFRPELYAFLVLYTVLAVFFFVQAIESLRPRSIPDSAHGMQFHEKGGVRGLRFFVDALRYDQQSYIDAWQSVRVAELNSELASQLHALARINKAKYNAVAKLYLGLQATTALIVLLLVGIGIVFVVEARRTGSFGSSSVLAATSDAAGVDLKAGQPKKGGLQILGEPLRLPDSGVAESSGVTVGPSGTSMFVVGDRGGLAEVNLSGAVIERLAFGGNLEDIAYHPPSGKLILLSEQSRELIAVDPATRARTARFKLDADALLGGAGTDPNQGFEGLAFRAEAGRPGGGTFYLAHQRAPALVVAVSFDPAGPSRAIGAESLVLRFPVGNRQDLTALTWDETLQKLLVIADTKDRIAVLGPDGAEEIEVVLPGVQQEGLAFAPNGDLWIADDQAGLFIFSGARRNIAAALSGAAPPATSPETKGKPVPR